MDFSANVIPVRIIPYFYLSFQILMNLGADNVNRDPSSLPSLISYDAQC